MSDFPQNIHPQFDRLLPRESRERLLRQHARVVWFTGLSGSGKTTIARELERALYEKGFLVSVLDGDIVRAGINSNLGFSDADRHENIRRIAEVAKLMVNTGVITLCCFVSPTEAIRQLARQIIGKEDFIEVYVNTPIEECERRDVKGLYAKARRGEIADFTGINAPFEPPVQPDLELKTAGKSPEQNSDEALQFLLPYITYRF